MSSLRNHRVVIASLFLPTTAVLGESNPPTPSIHVQDPSPAKPNGSSNPPFRHQPSKSLGGNTPLKSIVEDLKSRATSPGITTPPTETSSNPFAKFASIASPRSNGTLANDASPSPPSPSLDPSFILTPRKFQTTHTDVHHTARLQRKQSRSSSRRPGDGYPVPRGEGYHPWHTAPNSHCNGGLKNAIDSVKDRLTQELWVGTLGNSTDAFGQELRDSIDSRMRQLCASVPVWIPDAEFESCYDEFCHQVLWPCLHYAVPDAPKTKLFYESASFKQYMSVNNRFAEVIIANYREGDITDLVGFQTASYARHFRQTVSRILALEALPKGIQVQGTFASGTGDHKGRFVCVGVFPMGIDVNALQEKRRESDVQYWVQLLRQRYSGMKMIVGRDKLDEVQVRRCDRDVCVSFHTQLPQGVRHKIEAFERFLKKNPEFQGKVTYLGGSATAFLIRLRAVGCLDPSCRCKQPSGTNSRVASRMPVARVNAAFSTLTYQPIVFLHTQEVTFSQYLALLTVADAFLVTSLREGMALRTHEFVECQEGRHRPLILSEFTGSYSYSGFRSCIAVNPYDTRGTANAIYQALTMSDEEAHSRWEDLHNHVVTQTAQAFVMSFLTRCLRANTEHTAQTDLAMVPVIDMGRLLPRYKHSSKRLLLLDFEGAIWIRDMSRAGLLAPFEPQQRTLALLKRFADDPRNELWLLSGLPVKGVLDKIAAAVPGVGIVSENGCFIKTRETNKTPATWINMVANMNFTWKGPCVEILNYFTERTPGSFVEEPAEAQNHIFDSLGERYGLRIIPGANSFLVLPNNVSRSTAVGAILHPGGPAQSPRSGLAVSLSSRGVRGGHEDVDEHDGASGDETRGVFAVSGDEKLLRRLNELDNAETVSTSRKGTDAKWKLDPMDVMSVLSQLAGVA
ncbi:glycosyltransferase family 20 protein [Boletus reticuloceps]|uniref:Glycosyltransferase family 20 protein n=1 Tax=Boletus reticuloceps TaxID=495285 RepID=A0A8I2YSW9_9AGAM|nr:glycosyltransferase family 20 protein [Boletus reticuloceps]